MKRVFPVLFLILCLSSFAHATTYNVTKSGSDSNNCTQAQTIGTAKLTIAAGLACAGAHNTDNGAGDTVLVAPGTYSEHLVNAAPSGTVGNVFNLTCSSARGCIVDAGVYPNHLDCDYEARLAYYGFLEQGAGWHYANVTGFVFKGDLGFAVSGGRTHGKHHHLGIYNNEMRDNILGDGLQMSGVSDTVVDGNWIHGAGSVPGAPCDPEHQGVGYRHGAYMSSALERITFSDNIVEGNTGYGVTFYDDVVNDWIVDSVIERNLFNNNGHGASQAGMGLYGYRNNLRNNISISNGAEGFLLAVVGQTTVYNNTAWGNGAGGVFVTYAVSTTCLNNLSVGNTGTEIAGCNTGSSTVGNLTTGTPASHFVTPGSNFSLKMGSTAINTASNLIAFVTDDYSGASRTGTFDYGALMDSSSGDTVNPTLSSVSPTDNATGVSTGATLSAIFSEAVTASTGNINLMLSSNGSVVEAFDVTSDISGSGTTTISFTPASPLTGSTAYHVLIDAGALRDAAGNPYGGISVATTWNFTTAQAAGAPTVSTLTPTNGATSVAVNANLVAVFSEIVNVVSGNFVIKKCVDDSVFESIPIGDAKVTGGGSTTITVNPAGTFAEKTCYYATMASGIVEDIDGNDYAGPTAWSFTVGDFTNPAISALTPADGATGIAINANLAMVFPEAVTVQTGNIVIKRCADDTTFETIAIGSALVTGTTTTTITVNPAGTFANNTCYYGQVAAAAIDDLAGNSYAGISNTTSWNWTTIDDVDTTDPAVSSLSPGNNYPLISRTSNFVITFGEIVTISTGNIRIRKVSDNSVFETISVTGGLVTGTGTTTITINPAGVMGASTQYYIQIPRTAFRDATGNYFKGFLNTTDWRVRTVGP